jgi:branched-chain amino acid aminotransferase
MTINFSDTNGDGPQRPAAAGRALMDQGRMIWFRDKLVSASEALVPVLSPTAQFGLNVFEGLRGYWNERRQEIFIFRLDEHLDRLMQSCRLIGFDSPHTKSEIAEIVRETVRANAYREDIAVRVTLFVDEEGTWSTSEPVRMFVAPVAKRRRDVKQRTGGKACVSTWERINDRAMPPRAKVGANYVNGRYAHLEAVRNGYDYPILLDREGKVTEGAGSCVCMVRNGTLVTPAITASVLESITRDALLTLAAEDGISVIERQIDRTELLVADELFLCGSAAEVAPLTSIDRLLIGNGQAGAITSHLLARFLAAASGELPAHEQWIAPVYAGV